MPVIYKLRINLSDLELDPIVLNRIQEITSLANDDREHVFKVVDALIRDAKNRKAQHQIGSEVRTFGFVFTFKISSMARVVGHKTEHRLTRRTLTRMENTSVWPYCLIF